MRRVVAAIGLMCFASVAVMAAQFEITAFSRNGELEFSPAENAVNYAVEWSARLPDVWHGDWSDLESIPASSGGPITVDVPMFYRVVATIGYLPLYGVDRMGDPQLWEIGKKDATSMAIGLTKYKHHALAADYRSGCLYAVAEPDLTDSILYRVDHHTGGYEEIGSTGRSDVSGLAYDAAGRRLFGIGGGALMLINTGTGASGSIGWTAVGFSSLAYVASEDALYSAQAIGPDTLWRFDPDDAAATEIGPIGFTNVQALSYDPDLDLLYGSACASGDLITLDRSTGAGTYVGDLPNTAFNGLAIYTP